jgi:predicted MFS family arabinose efflux permease
MRREPTVPVALAGAAAFLGLYCTQPLLPLLSRTFGASTFAVGLTVTAPTVAVALAAPVVGRLADTIGLRRVIVGSAFLLAIATGLTATSRSLGQLIAWRFLQGIVTPGIFAGTVAYIHEMWPASRTGRATAAYMTGTILGGFTGRATAGLIAADANWHLSFVALGAIALTIAVSLALMLPAEPSAHSKRHLDPSAAALQHFRHASTRLFRNRQLVATYAIGFCVLFTNVAMFTYVTFHLAAPPFSLSTAGLGWLFVVYLIGAIVMPFGGRWIDAYGHRTGLAAAMGIGGVGALITLLPSMPAILAGLTLCSTGVFVAQTTTSSHIGAVTTEDRALAVGMYSTFYYTGGSLGAVAPAALWHAGGWPACVALVVAIQATGVWIALTFWSARREAVEPHPETLSA